MPRANLPVMRFFKPRSLAYIKVDRRRHYLGPWGSRQADHAYRAKVRELLGVACEGPIAVGIPGESVVVVRTVAHLARAYFAYAQSFYIKGGRPTPTAAAIGRVVDLLELTGRDRIRVEDADSEWLTGTRAAIAKRLGRGITRGTLNAYIGYVVRMFRFAGEQGLAADQHWLRLKCVRPIGRGRPPSPLLGPMREGVERRPVDRSAIRAVRPRLSRVLRIMLDVQLLTGMRPNELCHMRPADLAMTRTPGVRIYSVAEIADKTDHQEHVPRRRVWIGPRVMRLLSLLGPRHLTAFYFQPAEALEELSRRRRERRSTAEYTSADARRGRRRLAGVPPQLLGEHYTPDSYRRAVARACQAAIDAGVEGAAHFTPYQLRHNCATEIANRENIELAQVLLGHRDIRTTAGYVKLWEKRAAAAALKYG